MQRSDPFFQRQRPHKNGYLESLHRTYGEPVSALPTRGDVLYERAYQFRQNEKAKYAEIERDAESAREEVAETKKRYEALRAETQEFKALFEQLSKHYHESNDQRATNSAGGGGGDGAVRVTDQDQEASEGVSGVVPVEVLPAGQHVRGQATEHPPEGSEPGVRTAEATDAAGVVGDLPQDKD